MSQKVIYLLFVRQSTRVELPVLNCAGSDFLLWKSAIISIKNVI